MRGEGALLETILFLGVGEPVSKRPNYVSLCGLWLGSRALASVVLGFRA